MVKRNKGLTPEEAAEVFVAASGAVLALAAYLLGLGLSAAIVAGFGLALSTSSIEAPVRRPCNGTASC